MKPEGERPPAAEAATPKACPSCGKRYPADALFCSLDGAPLTTSPGAIAAAAATDPYVGREILGHIEIRQLVGLGAMGRVYRAFQRGIDRDLAVKILHRELSANAALVARFHREAKVASKLAHPHVVHVLLVGQLPDGAMHIVMEYLDGLSLQSALAAAGGAMPLPRALHIALQLCDAVGEAHAQGIVHRDVKPENVMLVRRADDPDFVKVLDFGIARLNWDEPSTATAAGLIFGTARYISPEGAQGERVTPSGDVYSIAIILYQMLSGRTPFDADQTVALLVQQIHDPPPPLKSLERSGYVPDRVAEVVMRNLAKSPGDRAKDARAFGRELLEAAVSSGLSAQDILARPALLGGQRGEHASVVQMPSMQRTKQLTLEPDVVARLTPPSANGAADGAASSEPSAASEDATPGDASVPRPASGEDGRRAPQTTAFETPEPPVAAETGRAPTRTEISDPSTLPPTAATAKWVPPSDFGARLAPGPSSPDATMDDQHLTAAPPRAVRSQTVIAQSAQPSPQRPGAVSAGAGGVGSKTMMTTQPVAPLASPTPSPARTAYLAPGARVAPSAAPPASIAPATPPPIPPSRGSMPSLPHTPAPPSRPPTGVDATLAGARGLRIVTHARLVSLVLTCFLVGVGSMSLIAWRAGLIGRTGLRTAATAASSGSRPAPATVEVVPESTAEAPRTTASIAEPSEGAVVPPLLGSKQGTASAAAAGSGPLRATLDASSGRPSLGQPVDFVARVASAGKKVDGARFQFSGPGISGGTEVPASDDGTGAYRTTFTFLSPGKFDVRFTARADGAPMMASRVVVVGDPNAAAAAPARPSPGPAATTQTTPVSDKWL